MRIRGSVVVNVICALGGVAIGGAAVGLWVQHQKSEWVEAYGTWFGAIATIVAVLWAVQTFRADQQHRETQEARAKALEDAAKDALEATALEAAGRISVSLQGGGGFGQPGEKQMNSVHVRITNVGATVATIYGIELDPRLKPLGRFELPRHVLPYDEWQQLMGIEEIAAPDEFFSGNPMPGYSATIQYQVSGREWERGTGDRIPKTLG